MQVLRGCRDVDDEVEDCHSDCGDGNGRTENVAFVMTPNMCQTHSSPSRVTRRHDPDPPSGLLHDAIFPCRCGKSR